MKFSKLCLLLLFFLTSCATTKSLSQNDIVPPAEVEWKEIKPGFEMTNQKIKEIGVTWTCVKIDLQKLETTPVIKVSEETFRVKSFARKNHLTVAINTTPFSMNTEPYKPIGIIKDKENILSAPAENYCALAITTDENGELSCVILKNQTAAKIEQYDYAIGGFFVVLQEGQILEFAQNRRSRTACGTDDTGSILYLFAVTPDFHLTDRNGLSYPECAAIMKQLGCTNAMQFDGGHSTAMVINGKNVRTPLFQRRVPAAMGF